jgi:tRNA-(ms[2]io[6]A)-hydroxylase
VTFPGDLHLLAATPRGWAEVVSKNVEHVLADHAHCELKAASTALSLAGRYSQDDLLADDMLALAREEMRHFASVRDVLRARGASLPPVGPDRYVKELRRRAQRGLRPTEVGLDALLICGFVEARSCERFRILAGTLEDPELRTFYAELAGAEARHHELFFGHARRRSGEEAASRRSAEIAAIEAELIAELPIAPRIH